MYFVLFDGLYILDFWQIQNVCKYRPFVIRVYHGSLVYSNPPTGSL
jgi:hypothetical protein